MKYVKTFEERKSSDYNNQYLTKEEESLLSVFITDYIKRLNILDKIDDLTLTELESDRFQHRTIFNNLIGINNSYTDTNSFYKNIDKFIKEKNINSSSLINRKSIFKIEDNIYKYYKPEFTNKLDNKIIELLSNIPNLEIIKKYYNEYSYYFTSKVKNAFSYIFNTDKFNI